MMIENTKCDCGHQNYVGTVLCESCGKPLEGEDGTEPLEMRYDGVARRSQRENPTIIDRVWRFFSSVKVAVYLIVITLCLATLGTIYPQENTFIGLDPALYYTENYGAIGTWYYRLGLSRTYESWWFLGLLFMIGTSLVVCSLDRVLPLYRALKKQQVRKHPQFLSRQKLVYRDKLDAFGEPWDEAARTIQEREDSWLHEIGSYLRRKRYRVYIEDSALMAEKNRFSRWGPYINHIGLIVFLLAALMRTMIPGWHLDEYVSIREGEIRPLPGTNYYLKNEQFTVEFYDDDEWSDLARERGRMYPKQFETKAVLYECTNNCDNTTTAEPELTEVKQHNIRVNQPLRHEGVMAYQFDYELTPQILSVRAQLKHRETGKVYGTMELDTENPDEHYTVGPYELELVRYYSEIGYKDGRLDNLSDNPAAPGFIFSITGPGVEDGVVHMYLPRPEDKIRFSQDQINETAGSPFVIEADGMDNVELALYTTFLNIRIDRGMPLIWIGAAISMIGLVMGFYWQHRRIWIRFDDGELLLGAHTNKNWYGLRNEVAAALAKMGKTVEPKSLANEVKRL